MSTSLTLMQIAQLLAFSILMPTGQIFFKMTAQTVPALGSPASFMALLGNLWFWAALVLYGVATLLWILILQSIPLSRAYPFVALGFILVPAVSVFLFGESVNMTYVAGSALIILGLVFVVQSA